MDSQPAIDEGVDDDAEQLTTSANCTSPASAIQDLSNAAAPGKSVLSPAEIVALATATRQLVQVSRQNGEEEFRRFEQTRARDLPVDCRPLMDVHANKTILVTGGTGCIGSTLVRELLNFAPGRVVSVSRGHETRWPKSAGVEYMHTDIRDRGAVLKLVTGLRPDIVYHLAAQHEPGLAEIEVARTLSTNVLGTINVIEACKRLPQVHLGCASTGKALRPFSRDIYAASKKMTEWVLASAANDGAFPVSAVRFTHVVDNSIILRRLFEWTQSGSPIRLHSPETMFYLQSALEAAQLLMVSVVDAIPDQLPIAAIRDLGWPTSLLDLAIGVISNTQSRSPIYLCGSEAGYEHRPYPALYDPKLSGSRSPLFSSLEVAEVRDSRMVPEIDILESRHFRDRSLYRLIEEIGERSAVGAEPYELRGGVESCGWAMLDNQLQALPSPVIDRHKALLAGATADGLVGDDAGVASMVARQATAGRQHRTHRRPPSHRGAA